MYAGKLVAVIADPVFSASDDRVDSASLEPVVAQAAPANSAGDLSRGGTLARLPHASEEADAIFDCALGHNDGGKRF